MDATDIVTILAVFLGPIFAVQIQKLLEYSKEHRNKKLSIFHVLMSTRGIKLSAEHVSALNMIDIEFYGKTRFGKHKQSNSEKKVTIAWKLYKDYLNTESQYIDNWDKQATDLFISLLSAMGQDLGYEFDNVQIKKDWYRPISHEHIENSKLKLLQGLVEVLDGEKAIPITIESLSQNKTKNQSDKLSY